MNATRGGYAPLENAGEFVCDCLRDGDRVSPRWGKSVHEQVVRCRDCEHYKSNTYSHFTCELLMFHAQPNDFCSWGEAKED